MKKKIIRIAVFVFILLGILLLYRSCTKVKFKELETLQKELMRSDKNIKSIEFYFIRPNYYANIVYKGEINDRSLGNIIGHFKKTLDYSLLKKIADTCWHGSFPYEFIISIYYNVRIIDLPPFYTVRMSISENSLLGSTQEKQSAWSLSKNYVDPVLYAKGIENYHSNIRKFYIFVAIVILFVLLCVFFARYLKKRGY